MRMNIIVQTSWKCECTIFHVEQYTNAEIRSTSSNNRVKFSKIRLQNWWLSHLLCWPRAVKPAVISYVGFVYTVHFRYISINLISIRINQRVFIMETQCCVQRCENPISTDIYQPIVVAHSIWNRVACNILQKNLINTKKTLVHHYRQRQTHARTFEKAKTNSIKTYDTHFMKSINEIEKRNHKCKTATKVF